MRHATMTIAKFGGTDKDETKQIYILWPVIINQTTSLRFVFTSLFCYSSSRFFLFKWPTQAFSANTNNIFLFCLSSSSSSAVLDLYANLPMKWRSFAYYLHIADAPYKVQLGLVERAIVYFHCVMPSDEHRLTNLSFIHSFIHFSERLVLFACICVLSLPQFWFGKNLKSPYQMT